MGQKHDTLGSRGAVRETNVQYMARGGLASRIHALIWLSGDNYPLRAPSDINKARAK